MEKRLLKKLWPPINCEALKKTNLKMKRNMKTKQTLLTCSTRIKKLMVMFKILKKDSKQRDINVPVFNFGVEIENNLLERNDSQKKT